MTETIVIDGRIRRVISKTKRADGLVLIEVVTGFRLKQSASGRHPGAGWYPVPGQSRLWTKSEPRVEEIAVEPHRVITAEDWPVGSKKHEFTSDDYAEIVKPVVTVAVEAAGAIGLRQVPALAMATCEKQIKDAGLAMPTVEEFDAIVDIVWRDAYQQKPRTQAPASITGRGRQRPAVPELTSEPTPSADEPAPVVDETPPE